MSKAETLAHRLKLLREAAGLTQGQAAQAAGLPVRTLQDYEQGRREPAVGVAARLAAALGVTLDVLVGLAPGGR